MKYSNTYIQKMGKVLLESKDPIEVAQAESVIEDWRGQHDIVLDVFEKHILSLLQDNGIIVIDRGRRLKRLNAIKNKMDRHNVWNLSTMQDVGGMRIILPTIDEIYKTTSIIESLGVYDFTIQNDGISVYIDEPRPTGYRAVHIVFKYEPFDKNNDCYGQKIELQLRTKNQHIWAMGVETAELITETALKDGSGDNKWQEFFKNISICFHSIDVCSSNYSREEKDRVNSLAKSSDINPKYIEELRTLMTMVTVDDYQEPPENKKTTDGYYLMDINYKSRISRIIFFSKEEKEKAIALYNRQEKENEGKSKDVVLVSVPKLKNLRDMYPSYYFDASEFIALAYKYVNKDMSLY